MDRFLTWPLIPLLVWCGFLLHLVSGVTTMPWYGRLATFIFFVCTSVGFGVWYGTSIKKGDNQ